MRQVEHYTRDEVIAMALEHYHGGYDEWGRGQIAIDNIVKEGLNNSNYFFAKKVTAIDCESDLEFGPFERTVAADSGKLFVLSVEEANRNLLAVFRP